jgi:hypothetical protein
VITPEYPPCQTLCVRRHNDVPYLAIWDAWQEKPNLVAIRRGAGGDGLELRTAENSYMLLFGSGEARFEDGSSLQTDGHLAMWRPGGSAVLIGGTTLEVRSQGKVLNIKSDRPVTLSAEYASGKACFDTSADIQYDTRGGVDHPRPAPKATVQITGDLWPVQE